MDYQTHPWVFRGIIDRHVVCTNGCISTTRSTGMVGEGGGACSTEGALPVRQPEGLYRDFAAHCGLGVNAAEFAGSPDELCV